MTRCSDILSLVKPLYRVDTWIGCAEEELDALRRRFGPLPQVLEDFYRTAAGTPALQACQDRWALPEAFQRPNWLQTSEHLVLLVENQGVCHTCIRRENLSQADPPVHTTGDRQGWSLCAPSTSAFLAAALTYEAVFYQLFTPEEFYELTEEEHSALDAGLSRYPFVLESWISGFRAAFYHNMPDNLAVVMEDPAGGLPQMLYGAGTKASYQALLDVVGGLGTPI